MFAKTSFMMVYVSCAVVACFIILTRNELIGLFTSDLEVKNLYTSAMIVLALEIFPESGQLVYGGIIKSLGKQDQAFKYCSSAQFLLGIPLSYMLGVHWGYGIEGLIFGYGVGNTLLCYLYHRVAYNENWQDVSD